MLILLFFLWIILSGQLGFYYIAAGLFSLFLTRVIIQRLFPEVEMNLIFFESFTSKIVFVIKLIMEIVVSSLLVSKIIWTRKIEIAPEEDYVDCVNLSNNKKVIYANSITLTPGTMSLKLEKDRIYVHALDKAFMEDLKKGGLMKIVEKIS